MKKLLLLPAVIAVLAPLVVYAADRAAQNVVVAKNEVVDDNFVRAGKRIEMHGTVEGDVVVAAESLVIDGTVKGDVIAVAEILLVSGTVEGSVRALGSSVTISGAVAHNVSVIAENFDLTETAVVGWSVQTFTSTLIQRGTVLGNVSMIGDTADVAADIGSNATYNVGTDGTLDLRAPTHIGGSLTYTTGDPVQLVAGVVVDGRVQHNVADAKTRPQMLWQSLWFFFRFASLFGVLVVGLVLVSLVPKTAGRIATLMREQPGKTIGWGILLLVVTPLVALLLLLTVIGAPLAILLLLLYGMALYVSRIFVGVMIGTWLFHTLNKEWKIPLLWRMVTGTALFTLLTWIPLLGGLLSLVGAASALGALVLVKRDIIQTLEQ